MGVLSTGDASGGCSEGSRCCGLKWEKGVWVNNGAAAVKGIAVR